MQTGKRQQSGLFNGMFRLSGPEPRAPLQVSHSPTGCRSNGGSFQCRLQSTSFSLILPVLRLCCAPIVQTPHRPARDRDAQGRHVFARARRKRSSAPPPRLRHRRALGALPTADQQRQRVQQRGRVVSAVQLPCASPGASRGSVHLGGGPAASSVVPRHARSGPDSAARWCEQSFCPGN